VTRRFIEGISFTDQALLTTVSAIFAALLQVQTT